MNNVMKLLAGFLVIILGVISFISDVIKTPTPTVNGTIALGFAGVIAAILSYHKET